MLATLNHIVLADGAYLRRLAGSTPAWVNRHRSWPGPDRQEQGDPDQLQAWVEEAAQLWERWLSEPFDPERVHLVDNGAYEVRAGVIVAQALHHANAHREQVCAILTGMDVQPPDLQPWEYAWATGRISARPDSE